MLASRLASVNIPMHRAHSVSGCNRIRASVDLTDPRPARARCYFFVNNYAAFCSRGAACTARASTSELVHGDLT